MFVSIYVTLDMCVRYSHNKKHKRPKEIEKRYGGGINTFWVPIWIRTQVFLNHIAFRIGYVIFNLRSIYSRHTGGAIKFYLYEKIVGIFFILGYMLISQDLGGGILN